MGDIFDAIAKARLAFMAADIKPPTVILLESHDEGIRFLNAVNQSCIYPLNLGDSRLGKEIKMADGSVWMGIEVMGIAIRWPANKYARKDGSYIYG